MDHRRAVSPETALASDIFDKFCSANTLKGILGHYRQLCSTLRIKPTHFPDFYPRLRTKLSSWRAQGLWSKFEKRAAQKCYGRGKACYGTRVLIIGAGPCGLRSAIEAQLLGAKVVLVEKRDRFSRNNVLHLWPFVISDLKALGAKKFYGKFCAGSIDHISIRQLQCILLKVALLLGVEVHEGVGFEGLREPDGGEGWRAVTSPADHPVSHYTFDALIGADGRRNTLDGFKRKALRAKLAIAITANFINKHTEAEARVKEISGVSYIFNQKFFQDLCEATGIDLENIVYYKDETHYFVMTAKKQSLLNKGVLLHDFADTAKLLSHENISTEALMIYALEAATFATEYQLPDIEFAVNHYGQPDVAMFDFTAMYAAENACRVVQRKGHKLLMTLVGDSLLEPFWPTGSGCARGFLSSFDAGWMLRSWTAGVKSVLEVVAERESIYRLLGQTTPENLQKEHASYSIDPHTRYPNLNSRLVMPFQVKSLYESDEQIPDVPDGVVDASVEDKTPKKRRRDSVIAIDSLLNWLREQVTCYELQVIDVREAFVQGDVLCAIIHRFRPDLIEFPLPSEENVDPLITAAFRNQLAFDILHQEYGLPHVMSGYDSVQFGSSDFLTLVAYLSQVYEIFRGEIPQTKYFKSESGDELDDIQQATGHMQALRELRMAVTAKHHFAHKTVGRKGRLSSGRESDSEPYRRHKKRRSDERSRISSSSVDGRPGELLSARVVAKESRKLQDRMCDVERFLKSMRLLQLNERSGSIEEEDDSTFKDVSLHLYRQTVPDFDERKKFLEQKLIGRESKTVFGKSLSEQADCEKTVPGLAKDLEAKFKGRTIVDKQKPKDMIRAIGKIEKSDWNVQLIEKKMAEVKSTPSGKKDKDNKVPRWSREAYDDKREAMKRKMDGATTSQDNPEQMDETFKKLGNKLKHGNALDVGQRGCNKVSAMAEQLIHKLERPKPTENVTTSKQTVARPAFELPKKGRVDLCHFCKERVYVVERMTAEGKFFHRNCFRCEYCNTSLRIGNYVFDREGRYGERFYCSPHYTTVKMYGWKKFDTGRPEVEAGKRADNENLLLPTSQQTLSEMDERGTTPERVEFENSVDFASEEELLNEIDEDEWTDRNNFSTSNADNTSDEASDLSDDEEVTPEGIRNNAAEKPKTAQREIRNDGIVPLTESSDSDTEVASEEEEEDDDEDEEDDDEEEENDECGGSTTEIETDSEFAEDPPNSVPGKIPTIVVDTPEQLVTKLVDSGVVNHAKHVHSNKVSKTVDNRNVQQHQYKDLYNDEVSVELVKKGGPERKLPVVTPIPKKWEPGKWEVPERLAKANLELKKNYLHNTNAFPSGINTKKTADPATQKQMRSVLDMISEQQKLLQPASKPSAAMQAFLDGADKLKNKTGIVSMPINRNFTTNPILPLNLNNEVQENARFNLLEKDSTSTLQHNNGNCLIIQPVSPNTSAEITEKTVKDSTNFSLKSAGSIEEVDQLEIQNSPEIGNEERMDDDGTTNDETCAMKISDDMISGIMTTSDTPSFSTSETDNTVIHANDLLAESVSKDITGQEIDSESDTVGSGEAYSDSEDLDFDEPQKLIHEPPRVEIEDEFGVTKPLDTQVVERMNSTVKKQLSSSDSSINSGIYLETEMSDYIKEGEVGTSDQKQVQNRKNSRKHGSSIKGVRKEQENVSLSTTADHKPTLTFDLEALDFADIDGVSSPEECLIKDKDFGQATKDVQQNTIAQPPTNFGCNDAPKCRPESQSPITSPSEDDERSSTSTRDPGDQYTSEGELSENISNKEVNDRVSFPILPSKEKNVPSLERVVPFSGVRDSLDYRKARGITSHLRNKELYSNYSIPSKTVELEIENSTTPEDRAVGSPSTTRKLNEIHQERVKQNDLIRSMVLGRIKKSPEKTNRKNSKGSISVFCREPSAEKSGEELDSHQSSDISQSLDGNTSEEYDRPEVRYSSSECNKNSSSDLSSGKDFPHRPMAESLSNSSDDSSGSQSAKALLATEKLHSVYEPVFTCSPRFRKFDKNNHNSQSQTEPPTPVNAQSNNKPLFPSDDSYKGSSNDDTYSVKNPLFCRSMPNLANVLPKNIENLLQYPGGTPKVLTTPNCVSSVSSNNHLSGRINPKNDPFLVSPKVDYSAENEKNNIEDDFLNLHLKIRPKDQQQENRRLMEKARSIYSADSSKEYSDSGYGYSNHPLPSSKMAQPSKFYEIDEWNKNESRRRANTLADLHYTNGDDGTSVFNKRSQSDIRHSIDNSDASKPSKSKAFSSDTLIDSPYMMEINRRTSVPDISGNEAAVIRRNNKGNKHKDRDRRRSLIQTVSDFFTSRTNNAAERSPTNGQSPVTSSTSSSSIMSPSKEKFSLFKLTPKLLQSKEKKNSSKSRECVVSPSEENKEKDSVKQPKTDYAAYLAQPEMVIQTLSASPTHNNYRDVGQKNMDECQQKLAGLSIISAGTSKRVSNNKGKDMERSKRTIARRREIEEIQLQLESIESDQRALESKGVKIEKKLRGEEQNEDNRSDDEIMNEWFALVRDKTKLARFEKELLARAEELELEMRREQLEEQLETSLAINDAEKSPIQKQRENEIIHELRVIDDQHSNLLDSIHADMERYTTENHEATVLQLEHPMAPMVSRLESDV